MKCKELTVSGTPYEFDPGPCNAVCQWVRREMDELIERYLRAIDSEVQRDPGLMECR